MLKDLLTLAAIAEALFLIGNLIAWRRNYLWGQEMQQLNMDLAEALHLASQGKYTEAEAVATRWRNRMDLFRMDKGHWKLDGDGVAVPWPWWRRWLGIEPRSRRSQQRWDWI